MFSEKDNRINKVIDTALKCTNELLNLNTVIGKPYTIDNGDVIFPVSKVFAAILSGGGEYGKTGLFKKENDLPYSVGSGTSVSVNPCGFLIKTSLGEYKFLSVGDCKYDAVIDKATEFIEKIVCKNE